MKSATLVFTILFILFAANTNAVDWENLAIDEIEEDTGYVSDVLDYIFLTYYARVFPDGTRRRPSWSRNTWDQIHF